MAEVTAPYIIQQGRVFARKNEKIYEVSDASYNISQLSGLLSFIVGTTAPFDGIVDEQGTFWQLSEHSVTYASTYVTLNLTEIFEARNLIQTPAMVTATVGGSSKTLLRDRSSDSAHGIAWKDGSTTIWTDRVVAGGGSPFWTDSGLSVSGGTITTYLMPNTTGYPGGWKALFSVVPAQIAFSVVSSGTYGENH